MRKQPVDSVTTGDGTNVTPAGDAVARSIFVRPNDGTNSAQYSAEGQKADIGAINGNPITENNGVAQLGCQRVTVASNSTGKLGIWDGTTAVVVETAGTKKALNVNHTDGTNDMPTGDAVARSIFVRPNDGTTTVVYPTTALPLSADQGDASQFVVITPGKGITIKVHKLTLVVSVTQTVTLDQFGAAISDVKVPMVAGIPVVIDFGDIGWDVGQAADVALAVSIVSACTVTAFVTYSEY